MFPGVEKNIAVENPGLVPVFIVHLQKFIQGKVASHPLVKLLLEARFKHFKAYGQRFFRLFMDLPHHLQLVPVVPGVVVMFADKKYLRGYGFENRIIYGGI